MELKITVFKKPTTQHYQLLLAADPSKELIDSYLNRSFCYQATAQGQLVGIIILLPTHPETLEIVNIRRKDCSKQKIQMFRDWDWFN